MVEICDSQLPFKHCSVALLDKTFVEECSIFMLSCVDMYTAKTQLTVFVELKEDQRVLSSTPVICRWDQFKTI